MGGFDERVGMEVRRDKQYKTEVFEDKQWLHLTHTKYQRRVPLNTAINVGVTRRQGITQQLRQKGSVGSVQWRTEIGTQDEMHFKQCNSDAQTAAQVSVQKCTL